MQPLYQGKEVKPFFFILTETYTVRSIFLSKAGQNWWLFEKCIGVIVISLSASTTLWPMKGKFKLFYFSQKQKKVIFSKTIAKTEISGCVAQISVKISKFLHLVLSLSVVGNGYLFVGY